MVISILGILVALGIPAYDYIIVRKQVEHATEDLYYYLKAAHSESLKFQAPYYVSFNNSATWCYGLSDTTSCDCTVAGSCTVDGIETVKRSTDYNNNITLAATGFSGGNVPFVQFEGLRGVASSTGSINISIGGVSSTVALNRIGLATVCSDQVASFISCANP